MPKALKRNIVRMLLFIICITVIISVPLMAMARSGGGSAKDREMSVLEIWQIDSFEGGKGSRAAYLQKIGDAFSDLEDCYVTVTTLTSAAARENLKSGNAPDLISYGAGTYGIEGFIQGETPYYCWCRGGYCFLTVEQGADFSDISAENTVVNGGTENLAEAAALLCGINGAVVDKPTGAYVKLINGGFKYMLGTQRDIFRLKTRGVAFSVKPVTEFNDLYQNISITSTDKKRRAKAELFINFLLSKAETVSKLGLMVDGLQLYDDEMHLLENITYESRLSTPISEQTKSELKSAIRNCDVKKLKSLLN